MSVTTRAQVRRARRHSASAGRTGVGWRAVRPALLLFLLARGVYTAVVLAASGHSAGDATHLLGTHWDADQYDKIATYGYAVTPAATGAGAHAPSNLAFFPLYPLTLRAVHAVLPVLPWAAVAVVVPTLASFAAAWGIRAAVAQGFGGRVADLTVVLWAVAPAAVVESAGYSESLFTALAAWALWALLTGRWLTAGLLTALAGLTRPTAVALIAAVGLQALVELYRARRGTRAPGDPALWRVLSGAALAPLGWFGYIGWTGLVRHSPTAYFEIQKEWHSSFDFGASTLDDIGQVLGGQGQLNVYYPVVACILLAATLLLAFAVFRRHPLPLVVFCAVIVAITLGDSAYFASRPRFLLPAFPLLITVASGLNRLSSRRLGWAVLAVAAVSSGCYGAYAFFLSPGAP